MCDMHGEDQPQDNSPPRFRLCCREGSYRPLGLALPRTLCREFRHLRLGLVRSGCGRGGGCLDGRFRGGTLDEGGGSGGGGGEEGLLLLEEGVVVESSARGAREPGAHLEMRGGRGGR